MIIYVREAYKVLLKKNSLLVSLLRKHQHKSVHNVAELPFYLSLHPSNDEKYKNTFIRDMKVYPDFINEEEEKSLCEEIENYFKGRRYEVDHWDDAIHGYRETDRLNWNPVNEKIIEKIRNVAFPPNMCFIKFVHILDIANYGYIKPHVDSVKFCGNTIAGLSLLSDSIMRLVLEENKILQCDVLLKRRSLYIMRDEVRFKFSHEILKKEDSIFKGINIERGRRISVMCRSEPSKVA